MADNPRSSVNEHIAARLRALRDARGVSLAALAERTGVSRSMLSLIERGESSPTATVLEKIATGLSVPLAELFSPVPTTDATPPSPLRRAAEHVVWRDPASGYQRTEVSPAGATDFARIVDVSFPAGAHIAFDTTHYDAPVHQQVWMLEGAMHIRHGDDTYELSVGDTLAFLLDRPTAFHNPTRSEARYAVVIVPSAASRPRLP